MARHGERAVAGVTSGLIGPGESVTWRARQFGFPVLLSSQITAFDRPRYFRDDMVAGPFKRFAHHHFFEPTGSATLMRDVFDYQSPLGLLGRLVDRLFLTAHMTRLLAARNVVVKSVAESGDWLKYLAPVRGQTAAL
jgi:ligand-binding SRPBCC domain-containing protein